MARQLIIELEDHEFEELSAFADAFGVGLELYAKAILLMATKYGNELSRRRN